MFCKLILHEINLATKRLPKVALEGLVFSFVFVLNYNTNIRIYANIANMRMLRIVDLILLYHKKRTEFNPFFNLDVLFLLALVVFVAFYLFALDICVVFRCLVALVAMI